MKKKFLTSFFVGMLFMLSGCAFGPRMVAKDYSLPPTSGNGILLLSFSYDAADEKAMSILMRPWINIEPVIEANDNFAARYKKAGATPNNTLDAQGAILDNKRVYLRADEWPAGRYLVTPQVIVNSGSIVRTYSFDPKKVTVVGGKIVYAGNFHYSGLKSKSNFLTGLKMDADCKVHVADEFLRDKELFLSKVSTVSGNEIIKDIQNP
ncbi:MAG: hypothetical protein HQL23_03690 [Candidatus Omnitrophica bacterium]|nr:hypothetical protein [Candidatus Omnitrophota bacterium]